jgi:hypothetical protein
VFGDGIIASGPTLDDALDAAFEQADKAELARLAVELRTHHSTE